MCHGIADILSNNGRIRSRSHKYRPKVTDMCHGIADILSNNGRIRSRKS